ncbi:plasmid pRiA4b ORF-3 family protein [Nonomuraea sp. NPDC047529]|uniref:plasmid pRiA4b ORF-3 family protein n=1 Tax=Nonomuraea sp. NPDC047529 TaxID=3155623 RepID=UPI0033FCFE09
MDPAYDLTNPHEASRFLTDDPAGGARYVPPGFEPGWFRQLASLAQFAEPSSWSHTLTGDEALAALTLLAAVRDWLTNAEPDLIAAARQAGVTWDALAPVLRVGDRRAAQRRYTRITQAAHAADAADVAGAAELTASLDRLPVDTRPLPSVDAYDDLLPSRRRQDDGPAAHVSEANAIAATTTVDVDAAPRATVTGRATDPGHSVGGSGRVHQIKITLRDVQTPVWRRVHVPSTATLAELHEVVQVAMGWEQHHLHLFSDGDVEYGDNARDESAVTLATLIPQVGDWLGYRYDMGNCWDHDLVVEKVHQAARNTTYPRCSAGGRACPPEDSGGPEGYAEHLRALRHRKGWKYQMAKHIFGTTRWDPAAWDRTEVNTGLAGLAKLWTQQAAARSSGDMTAKR